MANGSCGSPDLGEHSLKAEDVAHVHVEFELIWRAGSACPRIEYFASLGEESVRQALIRELLWHDIKYRRQAGGTPALAEYETAPVSLSAVGSSPLLEASFRSKSFRIGAFHRTANGKSGIERFGRGELTLARIGRLDPGGGRASQGARVFARRRHAPDASRRLGPQRGKRPDDESPRSVRTVGGRW